MTSDEKAAAVLLALATCPKCGGNLDAKYCDFMDVCWSCGKWVENEPHIKGVPSLNVIYRCDCE